MSDWTMAQAKRDFERGLLTDVRIVAVTPATWAIQITLGDQYAGWLVDARRKEPRQIKSVDAAIQSVKEIGFDVKQLVVVE